MMTNHKSRERAKFFVEQAIDEARWNVLYEAAKICADCYSSGKGADVAESRILALRRDHRDPRRRTGDKR